MAYQTWAQIVVVALLQNLFIVDETYSLATARKRSISEHDYVHRTQFVCPQECKCIMKHIECSLETWDRDVTVPPILPNTTTSLSFSHYNFKNINWHHYLKDFNDLHLLKIRNSQLRSIPRIPHLRFLTHLDLSNNYIEDMGTSEHIGAATISHLNISGNSINLLEKSSFEKLSELRVVDISRNPITIIKVDTFNNLSSLEYLDISKTKLTTVHSKWITDMPRLYNLNVSYTNLTHFPRSVSKSLQILDLSSNSIQKFPILTNLTSLLELHISNTEINSIHVNDTRGALHLQLLDMKNTSITTLNKAINELKSLLSLDISYNKYLRHIKYNAFNNLTDLQLLKISNCPVLYDIENEAFSHLHNLQVLDLRSIAIKVLPSSVRELKNLTTFNLDDTALLCDCHAYFLPPWLINVAKKTWTGVSPLKCTDGKDREHYDLEEYHKDLGCSVVEMHTSTNIWHHIRWGRGASLECNATGEPPPLIIWQSAEQKLYLYRDNSTYEEDGWPWFGEKIGAAVSRAIIADDNVEILQSGHLYIKKVTDETIGRYKCTAINSIGQKSIEVFIGVDDAKMRSLVLESFLFGIACATLFLLITLVTQFIRYLIERLECECCCCCKDRLSPKAKQIRKLLESVETYKAQQLEKLRDNYNSQVVGIKDSCYQQMEKLRESYTQQTRNLKDLRDYSTQGLQSVRDQYLDQINKVSEYSTHQMNRVRENYVFQRHKIRKFSAHQLVKLRETYKYQQKTLNKLLENLPDLYLQNCRTGGCQRTDSLIFDNEIQGLDAYYKLDFLDIQSYEGSDYYTPNSTLTRANKKNESKKRHSRNSSNTSSITVFQEAQAWLTKRDSLNTSGKGSPSGKSHNRSFSVATSPLNHGQGKVKPCHRRTMSACHSKHCQSAIVMEEGSDEYMDSPPETPMFSCDPSLAGSPPISPIHLPIDSPYHSQTAPSTPSYLQKPIASLFAPIHGPRTTKVKIDINSVTSPCKEIPMESSEGQHSSIEVISNSSLDSLNATVHEIDCDVSSPCLVVEQDNCDKSEDNLSDKSLLGNQELTKIKDSVDRPI